MSEETDNIHVWRPDDRHAFGVVFTVEKEKPEGIGLYDLDWDYEGTMDEYIEKIYHGGQQNEVYRR